MQNIALSLKRLFQSDLKTLWHELWCKLYWIWKNKRISFVKHYNRITCSITLVLRGYCRCECTEVFLGWARFPCPFWIILKAVERTSDVESGGYWYCEWGMLAASDPGFPTLPRDGPGQVESATKHLFLVRGVGSCHSEQRFKTSGKGFSWPLLPWATASSPVHSLSECRSEENTTENSIPLFLSVLRYPDRGKFHYTLMDS